MQKIVASFVALLCAFAFVSCNQEKYQKNNAAGTAWLANYSRSAGMSVNGEWVSPDWGTASLKQTGRKVAGSFGNYSAEGVVSGGKAYLLLMADGWVYYTAVVEKNTAGALVGHYSENVPFNALTQQPIILKRW